MSDLSLSNPPAPPIHFYIPATSSILERRPRMLKHGDTFAVFDHYGNIVPGEGSPEGLYHKDTRYLSDLRIHVNGRRPLLLSSTVQDNNALLSVDLTNPDLIVGGRIDLQRDTVHIVRSKFLWDGACYERLGIRNFDMKERSLELSVAYATDFVDMFEIRGHERGRRGETQTKIAENDVIFEYTGLDGVIRRTVLRFDPAPDAMDEAKARYRFEMSPRSRKSLFISVTCEYGAEDRKPARHFFTGLREARRALRCLTGRTASVETSNDIFNEVLCRGMADLSMLLTDTEWGSFPYAGIPWFSTAFGRDADYHGNRDAVDRPRHR